MAEPIPKMTFDVEETRRDAPGSRARCKQAAT